MPKLFIRDTAFFQNVRDRNMLIRASDLDDQFNNIVDYINNEVKVAVESLADNVFKIDEGKSRFVKNIGDGNIEFKLLSSADISTNSIALNKFKVFSSFGIIATNGTKAFQLIDYSQDNYSLISVLDNAPYWGQLTGKFFHNNSIDLSKLSPKTLNKDHLAPNTLGKEVSVGSVETTSIVDNSISNEIIAYGAYDYTRINNNLMALRNDGTKYVYDNKSISARNITDNSINYYPSFPSRLLPSSIIPINSISLTVAFPIIDDWMIGDNTLTPEHIQEGSVDFKFTPIPARKLSTDIRRLLGLS